MKIVLECILIVLFLFVQIYAEEAPKKIKTQALYSFFNQKSGELVLKGKARIDREDLSLLADEIFYNEQKKEAFATGSVKLLSKEFELESGQIRIYLPGNETFSEIGEGDIVIVAQKHPRLVQLPDAKGSLTQITAVEIKFYKKKEMIEAFENVRLVQLQAQGLQAQEEAVITGTFLEYRHTQKKALVKGNVRMDSKEMGGVSDRMIYYQQDSRLYLIGNAKVYEYNKDGSVSNTIRGDKILHLLKEKRTILMGDVEGSLEMKE